MPAVDLFSSQSDVVSSIRACDVLIIGSGPAGSTLAAELSGTGIRTVLLESGSFERRADVDALNEIENVGRPRAEQWSVRNRIVGGSSHTWGGRCAEFDDIDFVERAWVPASGWPLQPAELAPYLERSAAHLGLAFGTGFSDQRFWQLAGKKAPAAPDPAKLLPFFWQFSQDDSPSYPFEYTRFGRHLANRLGSNVTLIAGATVLRIKTNDAGNTVTSVEFAGPGGTRYTLAASIVVLCAGGIENARLLLSSNDVAPNGLGNDRDLVGRYLMDHLRGPCASFPLAGSEALQKLYGRYTVKERLFRAGLRLSPDIQASEQLLNCAAWLGETLAEDDPWIAVRHVLGGRPSLSDARTIATNVPLLLRGVQDYFIEKNGAPRKLSELTLEVMVEQRPDPESRVLLSDKLDRFGMRTSRIDWRSHKDEARTMRRMAELVAEQFARLNLPVPALAQWIRDGAEVPGSFVDVAHPTGTTRMSSDPAKGVVDAQCQVHGVSGLYVTGTSVFPTAGHCNPTQMIVALAVRLADAVKARVQSAKSTPRVVPTHAKTVLLTGGTGRIGRIVREDLLDRGYHVRATSSREPSELESRDGLEWRKADFRGDTDFDALVAGCDAVLHLAAEIGKQDRMQRVNVDATRQLARAAERASVQAFCYTSSVSVYGSGLEREIAEDSPVLTVDRDVASEYWALDYVRAYGRTKLAGEIALREEARRVRYVILRPTVVVDIHDIIGIRDWDIKKRVLGAHRHAHHVYVRDVSDAIIWSMERASSEAEGSVELFNLSEDEFGEPRHADFMERAFELTRDPRFRVLTTTWVGDWLHDFLRFRTLPLRNPLWRMNFSNNRLREAGYFPRFGLAEAQSRALETLAGKGST